MARWRDFDLFDSPGPRPAKGGIRAQSRRGAFGASWWAQRWTAVLESFDLGGRLGRGRSYARRGQVLDIAIAKGKVTARVQGSRPEPYAVAIEVQTLSTSDWRTLAAALSREALFAAKLLASEMPEDIELVFRSASLSLFPGRSRDLQTHCSCPDWSNPCKHVAAVYYLLGEEFDRDPFLIFRLRGIDREELVSLLGSPGGTVVRRARASAGAEPVGAAIPSPEPLPADGATFWSRGPLDDDVFGDVRVPDVHAGPLRRLRRFPFWRGSEPLLETLEPLYKDASLRSLEVFAGAAPT